MHFCERGDCLPHDVIMNFEESSHSSHGSAAAAIAAVRTADHHHEQQMLAAEAVRQAVERCQIDRVSWLIIYLMCYFVM